MKNKIIYILGTVLICCVLLFLTSCTNKNEQEIAHPINSATNEDIIKQYITDFLTKGYSKHYIINSFKFEFRENKVQNAKIEAIISTTMNHNVPPKDPEIVPYIKEAKEKAQKETDPEKKKNLQHEYEIMAKEYGKPQDSNFTFKLTANLSNDKIEEKSIKLFLEQDAENGVKYFPAEGILPAKPKDPVGQSKPPERPQQKELVFEIEGQEEKVNANLYESKWGYLTYVPAGFSSISENWNDKFIFDLNQKYYMFITKTEAAVDQEALESWLQTIQSVEEKTYPEMSAPRQITDPLEGLELTGYNLTGQFIRIIVFQQGGSIYQANMYYDEDGEEGMIPRFNVILRELAP